MANKIVFQVQKICANCRIPKIRSINAVKMIAASTAVAPCSELRRR
jgi:hypothetical protein